MLLTFTVLVLKFFFMVVNVNKLAEDKDILYRYVVFKYKIARKISSQPNKRDVRINILYLFSKNNILQFYCFFFPLQ